MNILTDTFKVPFYYEDVIVEAKYYYTNNGIGSYEYWGSCYYDKGIDGPEVMDVKPFGGDFPEIKEYIQDNYESIVSEIINQLIQN